MDVSPLFGPVAADVDDLEGRFRESFTGDDPAAAAPMSELFAAGGKRLRPALVLLSGLLGTYSLEKLLPAAIAVELIHAATLVHDDVIDRSATRRGRPTVVASAGSEAAIVIGDHYFAKAYREASRTGDPEVVAILAEAVMLICAGELEQHASRCHWRPDIDTYLRRIERKTAVLLAAACRIGARLGGLDRAGQEALARFGTALGLAFQIADDVLDYTGSEEELGKPVGHDLAEGMTTLPLMLTPGVTYLLEDGRCPDPEVASRVITQVREGIGPRLALERAAAYANQARAELAGFEGPAAEALAGLATYVVTRRL